MENLAQKKILITGASAGIGKCMVSVLAQKGVTDLAVMGRRADALEALKTEFPQVNFLVIAADMGKPQDVRRAADQIQQTWGALDVLINNAGVVSAGPFEEISDEDVINLININLTGLVLLTKHLMPLLKNSSDGALMNVSSGLGYIAQPFYHVYAATKAAVRQLSDGLRREYHAYPLHVMTVYPTATDTPMMRGAQMEKAMDDPMMVAEKSIEGMINGEREVIFGGPQRLEDIKTNHLEPEKIDEKAKANFEALRKRTETHRAM